MAAWSSRPENAGWLQVAAAINAIYDSLNIANIALIGPPVQRESSLELNHE
jgi:hypothetical protein